MNCFNNYRYLLASLLAFLLVSPVYAADRVEVIETDIDRSNVTFNRIDSENIEVSVGAGLLAIEDFDTSSMVYARFAYHLNPLLFLEASVITLAEGDKTSFEELSGTGTTLIQEEDRDYFSWDLSAGINLFPGETWLFGRAYSSDLYVVAGAGNTDFGGSTWTTINVGVGYRFFINDSITLRWDLRDHIFNRDIFGEDDSTNNIEITLGTSIFF